MAGVDVRPPVERANRVVQHDSAAREAERSAGLIAETDVRFDVHRVVDGVDAGLDFDPRPGQSDGSVPHFGAVDDLSASFGPSSRYAGAPEGAGGYFELMQLLIEPRAQVGDLGAF